MKLDVDYKDTRECPKCKGIQKQVEDPFNLGSHVWICLRCEHKERVCTVCGLYLRKEGHLVCPQCFTDAGVEGMRVPR